MCTPCTQKLKMRETIETHSILHQFMHSQHEGHNKITINTNIQTHHVQEKLLSIISVSIQMFTKTRPQQSLSSLKFSLSELFYLLSLLRISLPEISLKYPYYKTRALRSCPLNILSSITVSVKTSYLQDTRYIKYAEQKQNARNNRVTVKYPA
jgi:hypothetical protein